MSSPLGLLANVVAWGIAGGATWVLAYLATLQLRRATSQLRYSVTLLWLACRRWRRERRRGEGARTRGSLPRSPGARLAREGGLVRSREDEVAWTLAPDSTWGEEHRAAIEEGAASEEEIEADQTEEDEEAPPPLMRAPSLPWSTAEAPVEGKTHVD